MYILCDLFLCSPPPSTHTFYIPPKYRMVTKATLDLLLVFVNYTEQTESSSGGSVTPVRGVDSPSRLESPDGLPTNSLLFKDAVEIVAEEKGD